MKSSSIKVVLAVGVFILAVGLMVQATQASADKRGGTLTIGISYEPQTLDTLRTSICYNINMYVNEPAITWSPEGEMVPNGWIKDYEVTDDGKTLTFHLREGVTFHDGTPLDADAWAWGLRKRITDESIWDTPLRFIESPEDIVVLDKYTLQIKQTDKANPNLLPSISAPDWCGAMMVPEAKEKYGETYGSQAVIGNGPFKFVKWVKGDRIVYERYEEFDWAPKFADNSGPVYIDKLIFKIVPEEATRVNMLKTGELDAVLNLPYSAAKNVEKMENIEVKTAQSYQLMWIEYNVDHWPLSNEVVRKALNYATDREAIADKIYFGYADPAYSGLLGYPLYTDETLRLYKYDPEKAKKLLTDDGWEDSDGDGTLEKNGKELKFKLWSSTESNWRKIAEVMQGMWRNIGAKAEIQLFDEAALRDKFETGEHDATLWRHEWAFYDEYYWVYNPELSAYPAITHFDTPRLRELIEINKSSSTYEEFQSTAVDLVNYAYSHAITNALVYPQGVVAVYDYVKNFEPRGTGWALWAPYLYDTYMEK